MRVAGDLLARRFATKGRVAIEASAGTGKTYTLAGLVVRYVAEQAVPIDKILIVTFTRGGGGGTSRPGSAPDSPRQW